MEKHMIYCSACDRDVAIVVLSADDAEETDNTLMDVVCTEIGESCTGMLCPISAKPPDETWAGETLDGEW